VYCSAGGQVGDSLVAGNTAPSGGGFYGYDSFSATGSAVNCTITANTATERGGGTWDGLLMNCIVYGNTAPSDANSRSGTLIRCFTNEPGFINASAGNYRLQYGSACINAGSNDLVLGAEDLDGQVRVVAETVDIGAYEYDAARYDSDGDGMRDAWEILYALDPLSAGDAADHDDDDGIANFDEFVADTNPRDGANFFEILGLASLHSFDVTFACSTARLYTLEFTSDLVTGAWSSVSGVVDVPGDPSGTLELADPEDVERRNYRVGVRVP